MRAASGQFTIGEDAMLLTIAPLIGEYAPPAETELLPGQPEPAASPRGQGAA